MAFSSPQTFYLMDTDSGARWKLEGVTNITRSDVTVHEGRVHRDLFAPDGYTGDQAETADDAAVLKSGFVLSGADVSARVPDNLMHVPPRETPLKVTVIEFTLGGAWAGATSAARVSSGCEASSASPTAASCPRKSRRSRASTAAPRASSSPTSAVPSPPAPSSPRAPGGEANAEASHGDGSATPTPEKS